MKQIDEHRFQAEEWKTFVHKTTQVRMGNMMYLGDPNDSVDNYAEEDMTEEEIAMEKEQKDKEAEK